MLMRGKHLIYFSFFISRQSSGIPLFSSTWDLFGRSSPRRSQLAYGQHHRANNVSCKAHHGPVSNPSLSMVPGNLTLIFLSKPDRPHSYPHDRPDTVSKTEIRFPAIVQSKKLNYGGRVPWRCWTLGIYIAKHRCAGVSLR